MATLYDGEELYVGIYEASPAKVDHSTPFPFDELVFVVSGKLVLTEIDGTRHEYVDGGSVMVPKGFIGTWEMQGNYHEIAVIFKGALGREY